PPGLRLVPGFLREPQRSAVVREGVGRMTEVPVQCAEPIQSADLAGAIAGLPVEEQGGLEPVVRLGEMARDEERLGVRPQGVGLLRSRWRVRAPALLLAG